MQVKRQTKTVSPVSGKGPLSTPRTDDQTRRRERVLMPSGPAHLGGKATFRCPDLACGIAPRNGRTRSYVQEPEADEDDIHDDGVNVPAQLEGLAGSAVNGYWLPVVQSSSFSGICCFAKSTKVLATAISATRARRGRTLQLGHDLTQTVLGRRRQMGAAGSSWKPRPRPVIPNTIRPSAWWPCPRKR